MHLFDLISNIFIMIHLFVQLILFSPFFYIYVLTTIQIKIGSVILLFNHYKIGYISI